MRFGHPISTHLPPATLFCSGLLLRSSPGCYCCRLVAYCGTMLLMRRGCVSLQREKWEKWEKREVLVCSRYVDYQSNYQNYETLKYLFNLSTWRRLSHGADLININADDVERHCGQEEILPKPWSLREIPPPQQSGERWRHHEQKWQCFQLIVILSMHHLRIDVQLFFFYREQKILHRVYLEWMHRRLGSSSFIQHWFEYLGEEDGHRTHSHVSFSDSSRMKPNMTNSSLLSFTVSPLVAGGVIMHCTICNS